MRRKNRDIEIFSLSAIDLFASTLGAFVIITAILLPYYPNLKDGGKITARLHAEIDARRREMAAAEGEMRRLVQEERRKSEANDEAARARASRESLRKRAAAMRSANDRIAAQVQSLSAELEGLKAKVKEKERAQVPTGITDFSILGITTRAKKILIIVDLSGSMAKWSQTLVNTLLEIIEPFHAKIQFGIIGYQWEGVTQYWPLEGRMAIGDDRSKRSARAFISLLPGVVNGSTPTNAALLRGLRYRPEAIILVSDGNPTDDEAERIIDRITHLNRKKIEIHTVAVGDYLKHSALIQFLNNLAKKNRGQFVGVMHD